MAVILPYADRVHEIGAGQVLPLRAKRRRARSTQPLGC